MIERSISKLAKRAKCTHLSVLSLGPHPHCYTLPSVMSLRPGRSLNRFPRICRVVSNLSYERHPSRSFRVIPLRQDRVAQSQFVENVFRSGFASVVIIDLSWVIERLNYRKSFLEWSFFSWAYPGTSLSIVSSVVLRCAATILKGVVSLIRVT